MLALLSWVVVAAATGILVAISFVAAADVPILSAALRSVLPQHLGPAPLALWITVGLQFGGFFLVRFLFSRLYTYADETEAAPRDGLTEDRSVPKRRQRRRRRKLGPATLWTIANRLFADPAGYWARLFVVPLAVVVALAFPFARVGIADPRLWGLSSLFVFVLTELSLRPDKPDRLMPADESQ